MARNVVFMTTLFLPRVARDCYRCKRNFGTSFNNGYTTSISSNNPKEIIGWMRNYAPVFEVRSDAISVLSEPTDFYNTLTV